MHKENQAYNENQPAVEREICQLLAGLINQYLPEADFKIWHAHPVWFLVGNPIVGYSKLKDSVRLLFWSGQSFEEAALKKAGSFMAAEIRCTAVDQINPGEMKRWLHKARDIQWDYKHIVRRKGKLERLK